MKPTKIKRRILTPLALALALGVGLGASSAQAQTILDVGGADTIGVTTLPNGKVPAGGMNWKAAGGEGFKNSDLVSPPVTITTTGPVTLKFSHRYFFEAEWDGGAVFVIVNDQPAVYLPGTAFTANGYVGNTLANEGSAWPGGENVFYNKSAGYDASTLIESVANLGTLNAGDTVSVQFRGRWDGGYAEPTTNWEMGAVQISDAAGVRLNANFTADGMSGFTVSSDAGLAGPWTYVKPTSLFELDATATPPLTADRYAPATPGTNIDLNGANIKVVLLAGTPDPGEVFTLFDLSGGTTISGTPGTIELPRGTWDASNLAVNGTIVCEVPVLPPTPPPVTNGMMVWLTAEGVDPTDPAQVSGGKIVQWNDLSGNNRHATNTTASQRPAYIEDAMNGKPVLRFTESASSKLFLGDLSAAFWATPPVDPTPTAANIGTAGATINGTYMNVPTRGVAGALVGDSDTAISLNGTTQYVTIPYSADLNPAQGQPWSAEIWAKSNVSGTLPPFSSGTPGNVTNRQGWVLYFINSDLSFRAYTNNGANTTINGANGLTMTGLITPNTWYHVVVTCDGTDFRIYLNGVEVGSTPTVGPNGTYSPGNTGTALGFRLGAGNYFNGLLDEAAFYTTTLSQPRILAHYQNGINDPARSRSYDLEIAADSPVAHYKLNEPVSPVAAASVFVVAAPNNDGRYNLFGNRANDDRWVANTWTESSPGSFRGTRAAFAAAGYALWPQTGAHVYSMESGPSQYRFALDGNQDSKLSTAGSYHSGAGANWTIGDSAANNDQRFNGDIAEMILFNRVLTAQEAAKVGGYLEQKYGLNTNYPPLNLEVKLVSPGDAQAFPQGAVIEASATVEAGSVSGGTAPYTVEFWVDNVMRGSANEEPYTFNLPTLTTGTHEIFAKVTDSTSPTPLTATSATHSFTVAPAVATTTTITTTANPSVYGSATVTATVVAADASSLSGGTVQFFDGGEFLGNPVAVDTSTGEASYSIAKLSEGPHTITAEYSGHGYYITSSSSALSQVVNKAVLTVTANNVFRPTGIANPDPLPYTITGYQNGEKLATSGVFGAPTLSTAAVLESPAGIYPILCELGNLESTNYSFTLVNGTLTVAEVRDTFSINFYAYGALPTDEAKANVRLTPSDAAGFGSWLTSGWTNIEVPWAPTAPQNPVNLTSNRGSTATFRLNDCRNGGPYLWATPRTTMLGDSNGNMMDAHVNSTLDPDNGVSNSFKMEMTNIPFPVYDVIFYMGANQAQFGDGKGAIVFNGGAERDFTLKSGAFDGTFTEMVDATTPGNYIVFKGVTGSSFIAQTYGKGTNGFNHVGPCGIQIQAAGSSYDTWAGGTFANGSLSDKTPGGDPDGDGQTNQEEFAFGLDPTSGASANPISQQLDKATGVFKYTRNKSSGLTYVYQSSATLTDPWDVFTPVSEVSNGATPLEEITVTVPPALLGGSKLFLRVKAQ